MEKPHILHMLTPGTNVSPFDVNMALDAGYHAVMPYTGVTLEEVATLIQDAIFSRSPKAENRTGIFIGGRDIGLAADMLARAKESMVPPFEASVFADPSGAFTTAAAMVAAVERQLKRVHDTTLLDKRVVVLGGTGPVGAAAAVLAAKDGARVRIAIARDIADARSTADDCNARYGTALEGMDAASETLLNALMQDAEVVLATSKAGVQVLRAKHVGAAPRLLVAADVNAVPPAGIEGIGLMDDGVPLPAARGAVGIGPLTIGNIKYQTMHMLFAQMLHTEKPVYLDFREAFAAARKVVG
jgi:methylene-tetrahydromethanopterin dehydrogenase